MKSIIESNYESIVKRGLINWSTPLQAFLDKLNEEVEELHESVLKKEQFSEELADVILVCLNTAKHFDIDIEIELKNKIQKNFNR